jgi:F-type H+-transporting ATPase subunit b
VEQHGREAAGGHGGAESEAESPWAAIARLFNFAVLAGALVYLLRSPLMGYLERRGVQVRSELTKAAALRQEAGAQLAQIDAKMQALPSEIEALKRHGAEEIAAEESRIRSVADAERRRLLDQATREIDTELRLAERALRTRAGELAVDVATERITRTITDRDHLRLVDRYVEQVRH